MRLNVAENIQGSGIEIIFLCRFIGLIKVMRLNVAENVQGSGIELILF